MTALILPNRPEVRPVDLIIPGYDAERHPSKHRVYPEPLGHRRDGSPIWAMEGAGVQTWRETLTQSVTDGPTLTAAARASCIPTANRIVLPNSYFYVGKDIKITASGRISSVITTPGTARFDICLGSAGTTIVWDSLAILLDTVAAHTTVAWFLEVILTCRAIGTATSTTFFPTKALWTCEDILGVPATAPKGVLSAVLPWNTAPAVGAGMDNTAASALDMFFTQTVATGSLTVHSYLVEALN